MSFKDSAQPVFSIMEALSYASRFHGHLMLIKIGGSILNKESLITSLCEDIQLLKKNGIKVVLVHGGSKAINEYLDIHQVDSHFIDGLRVTSEKAIKVIEMVLCGHVNKLLVRKLNSIGLNAVGLCGSDDSMLKCDYYSSQHGFVGKIKQVFPEAILNLLSFQDALHGSIPVIAPIGVDEEGNPLNINADVAASEIAHALKVNKLIYLTDQEGVYDEQGHVYSELKEDELALLVEKGIVKDGMLVKVKAILAALQSDLNEIHILNGNKPHILIEELFTLTGAGTLCKKKEESVL